MTSHQAWADLAASDRWNGIVSFIRNWAGRFDSEMGIPPEELDGVLQAARLTLPAAVREWYLLAGRWKQGGLNVWIPPRELAVHDGALGILTDPEGVNLWGVLVKDTVDDPPAYCLERDPIQLDFPNFSKLVTAMVANDVIFDYSDRGPKDLNRTATLGALTRFASMGSGGEYLADRDMSTATVVCYCYPKGGPVCGRSRTPAGLELLERLRQA
jgi:hypothetical protein